MKYQAKKINHGHVLQTMQFDAATPIEAYAEANNGIDPLTGIWVSCNPAPQLVKKIDPAKLAPKSDALNAHPNGVTNEK